MNDVGLWESAFLWRNAVVAVALGALILAYVGCYVLWMRAAFVSAAISQMSGLGVVLAFLAGATEQQFWLPLLGGGVLGIAAATLLALPERRGHVPRDAVLACVVVGASAATLMAGSYLTMDYRHVQAALFGDVVVSSPTDLVVLSVLLLLLVTLHKVAGPRWLAVIADADSARIHGIAVRAWSALMGIMVGLSIAVCARSFGAMTAFALCVVPATAAAARSTSTRGAQRIACGLGITVAIAGYLLSFAADLPAGPTIVVVAIACWLLLLVPLKQPAM